jgi:copper(I)-binding protein
MQSDSARALRWRAAAWLIAPAMLLALAGCDSGSPIPQAVPSEVLSATATPMPLPVFSAGRLVLPAVPGNPGAAYFTVANSGEAPVILTGVIIAGSTGAEFHETSGATMRSLTNVTIPGNGVAMFQPGGKHVMVFGLNPSLAVGHKTDVTLTLSDGRIVKGTLTIDPPGDAAGPTSMTMPDASPMKM